MFEDMFHNAEMASEEDVEFLPMISIEESDSDDNEDETYNEILPVLPLRNTVLFPGVVIPITVGRDKSLIAVKEAYKTDKLIAVLAQKDVNIEDPEPSDLNTIGTIARIVKILKMPDGSNTVIMQGRRRFRMTEVVTNDPYLQVKVEPLKDSGPKNKKEYNAIVGSIKDLATQIIKQSPNIPTEAGIVLKNIDNPRFLLHFISSNMSAEVGVKQTILETDDLHERANLVYKKLDEEFQLLELKNQISSKVKSDIDKQQRDYFLHQQMKTIQEELGGDNFNQEIEKLRERATSKKWSKEVQKTFTKELAKLERMNVAAAEYSVQLNYLELMLDLPWEECTKDNLDINRARKILNEDHYGLEKIKERILEYLAVLKLKGDMKSPILCFVGPPGVGKTSLGRSIARAMDRKYVRMSLGGLGDESEIRGHRKTYIGAMPGRVLQSFKKVKSSNPVFILDEIDKLGSDFRGDPSSALLEVLDPEQNSSFYDNYLEMEYDLSKTLFIATANSLGSIQPALRDRMEIIRLNGYSIEEKLEIAKKYLVPKERKAHGLKAKQITINPKSIEHIIDDYTRESGVRDLDRQLASVMRNTAKTIVGGDSDKVTVKPEDLTEILGPARFSRDIYKEKQPPGVAVGLAWTSVGGDILFIETSHNLGRGRLILTGNLGNVMRESAMTALSLIKRNANALGLDIAMFDKTNIHVHVPEGAIPKDGPSAGITMLTSIASSLLNKPVKPFFAMTGEITLRGKVLPVGGIKEKILAAKRSGLKNIVLCQANEKDILEIEEAYLKGLKFHYVDRMEEVLSLLLGVKLVK